MSNLPESVDPRDKRVSHADREQVAGRLQQASTDGRLELDELDERLKAAYAARTYADLEPLTRDLPSGTETPAHPVEPARPTSRWAVAVLGGFQRRGAWVVPRRFSCVALLGGGTVDLRRARFSEGEVKIHVYALMGGVEVVVPPEATVDANGVAIMGGWEQPAEEPSTSGGPRVTVTGLVMMGGVEVKRRARAKG